MNTFVKKLGLVAAGAFFSASASAVFIPFYIDPDGSGTDFSPILVNELIDISGSVDVENTFSGGSAFTFTQTGTVGATQIDSVLFSGADLIANQIGASFVGTGEGDLLDGSINFTGGTLDLFSGGPGGTIIASFVIEGGSSSINTTSAAPNGESTIVARAQSFEPGYFFTVLNGGGVGEDFSTLDLSTSAGEEGLPLFGFSTTNLSITSSTSEGPLLTDFTASIGGQFRLETVPVPATLALMGLGMLGLVGISRRRKTA